MHRSSASSRRGKIVSLTVAMLAASAPSYATESDATTNVPGVAGVLSGAAPPPGFSWFEYNSFYGATEITNSRGNKSASGFKVSALVTAPRLTYMFPNVIDGVSIGFFVAQPFLLDLNVKIPTPYGIVKGHARGPSDLTVSPLIFGWQKDLGPLGLSLQQLGLSITVPDQSYRVNSPNNLGLNRLAWQPYYALTIFPTRKINIGAQINYTYNEKNHADNYLSGQEIDVDFEAGYKVLSNVSLELNGYYYKQISADRQNGAEVDGGNFGQVVGLGPQVVIALPPGGLAIRYQREFFAENRSEGNRFWFQFFHNF